MTTQPQPTDPVLPHAFPDGVFEVVEKRISRKMEIPSSAWQQLVGGHNGVRLRLWACSDYSEKFTQWIQQFRNASSLYEYYRQEQQLFGFFLSGYAALDSFCYFMYFAAAQLQPSNFHTTLPGHIKSISCTSTAKAFAKGFPGEAITTALDGLLNDQMFKDWESYRNILAHRVVPSRSIYASTGSSEPDPSADWKIGSVVNLKIDENLTPPRLAWLVNTLKDLVAVADTFAQKHF